MRHKVIIILNDSQRKTSSGKHDVHMWWTGSSPIMVVIRGEEELMNEFGICGEKH